MTHRSTELAKIRERDRDRQRRRRGRMKALGIPQPHQCDSAITEATSYALALALADKDGIGTQPAAQTTSMQVVFKVAFDILTKRWRFDQMQSANALKARLAKRQEHSNPYWVPHFPSCEPACWTDTSRSDSANTPVTSSGHVQDELA